MLVAHAEGGTVRPAAPGTGPRGTFVFPSFIRIRGGDLGLAGIPHRVPLRYPARPPRLPGAAARAGLLPTVGVIGRSLRSGSDGGGLYFPAQEYLQ